MAVFRCNMCGGTLIIDEKNSIATCEYCGTVQSLSKIDNDLYEKEKSQKNQIEAEYASCVQGMNSAKTPAEFNSIATRLSKLDGYQNSALLYEKCIEQAEIARKNVAYNSANAVLLNHRWTDLEECIAMHESAIRAFEAIRDWKDSSEKIEICKRRIENVKNQAEEEALAKQQKEDAAKAKHKKAVRRAKKIIPISAVALVLTVVVLSIAIVVGLFFGVRLIKKSIERISYNKYSSENVQIEAVNKNSYTSGSYYTTYNTTITFKVKNGCKKGIETIWGKMVFYDGDTEIATSTVTFSSHIEPGETATISVSFDGSSSAYEVIYYTAFSSMRIKYKITAIDFSNYKYKNYNNSNYTVVKSLISNKKPLAYQPIFSSRKANAI